MTSAERAELHGLVAAMSEEHVREVLEYLREMRAADYLNRVVPWDDDVPTAKKHRLGSGGR